MKIAMVGTRGIPANYSGFETAVEEISTRLVKRGHEVIVYCRPHMIDYKGADYKGVRLVKLPTIANKHLDTFVHTFLSTIHMIVKDRCDVALYFIAGNSPFSFLPRVTRIPTAINVDGMDSKRDKWGRLAKTYLRFTEWLAPHSATAVIADSRVIQRYYRDKYGAESVFIPYGADMREVPGNEWLDKFGIKSRDYLLFVGRLVPENRPHVLIEAFNKIDTDKKLVIVGDAPYADEYIQKLKKMAGKNVIFTGYVFGEGYCQLSQNAYVFVVPTIVGGTHPVIVEALAAGNCVLVSDHPPNLETVGDAGISFDAGRGADDLNAQLTMLLNKPDLVEEYRQRARERAKIYYDWEVITAQYENLCKGLLNK
jgi:glycosyltransferase involved in cell wall biosynthesis